LKTFLFPAAARTQKTLGQKDFQAFERDSWRIFFSKPENQFLEAFFKFVDSF